MYLVCWFVCSIVYFRYFRFGCRVTVTTIFVPIVQALLDRDVSSVSRRTWVACFIALAGVAVMGVDWGAGGVVTGSFSFLSMIQSSGFTVGDGLVVGAALLYTLHVVRLGYWAGRTSPLKLSSSKAVVQSIFSVGLVGALIVTSLSGASGSDVSLLASAGAAGREILDFFGEFTEKLVAGEYSFFTLSKIGAAITWSGVIGTAYVLYAQSFGQRTVRPSDANLVYSLQPIFTSIFAFALLGETMSPAGFVGGGLILGAVYLVASNRDRE